MFDVAVVGAGPGGSWAAHLLAQSGARVALVDGSHPREKPCGGGVTRRALDLVVGAVPQIERIAVPVTAARFVDARRGRTCVVPLAGAPRPALVVASRCELDRRLLQRACESGAEHVRTRARDIHRTTGGFSIATTERALEARVVIGADGATSLVRRKLAVPFRRDELSIATGFFAHGTTDTDVVIEFSGDPPGYLWSFPRPDHLAVGICAQADAGITAAALRERAGAWMRATGIGRAARWEAYSWPVPSLGASAIARSPVGGDDWYLVGDAAGLVDPITREGIYFALRSAALAAETVGAGRPGDYTRAVRSEIVPELARAARLKAGFFRPAFTDLVLDALEASARIRHVMADLITGEQPYRGLALRLAATGELALAWKLATLKVRGTRRGPGREHPDA